MTIVNSPSLAIELVKFGTQSMNVPTGFVVNVRKKTSEKWGGGDGAIEPGAQVLTAVLINPAHTPEEAR